MGQHLKTTTVPFGWRAGYPFPFSIMKDTLEIKAHDILLVYSDYSVEFLVNKKTVVVSAERCQVFGDRPGVELEEDLECGWLRLRSLTHWGGVKQTMIVKIEDHPFLWTLDF